MSSSLASFLAWAIHGCRIPARDRSISHQRAKPRRGPERIPEYRAFVRQFPCCACGVCFGIEAAHTGAHGLGQKSSDRSCIPLCASCHRTGQWALHRLGPL